MPGRALCTLVAVGLLAACSGVDHDADGSVDGGVDASDAGPDADAAPTCTELAWDPVEGQDFGVWPDPTIVVEDEATRTGYRLHIEPGRYPHATGAAGFSPVFFDDIGTLDGFGVNASLFFKFGRAFDDAMLPTPDETTEPGTPIGVVLVSPGETRAIPVRVETSDLGATLVLTPQIPLPEHAHMVAFVTRGLTETAGGCLESSSAMRDSIEDPNADTTAAIAALTDGGFIDDTDELIVLTAFPTQSIHDESLAIAEDIAEREVDLDGDPVCTTETLWVRCEASITAGDYRDESDGAVAPMAMPTRTYSLPVTFWLPRERSGPAPTILFGHGLASGRDQAERLAEFAAPLGYVTVAIDAPQHGDHPTTPVDADMSVIGTVLRFFAVGDFSTRLLEGLRARDNFRQATYDKLQLLRVLEAPLDVDGDETPDVDPTRLAYLGVSLGGIMGPEMLALTDAFRCAVLVVPGGRVSSIVSEGPIFRPLLIALRPAGTSEGDVDRFFSILQTVLDRGDPASYAPHVLRDRLRGEPRSLLMGMVLDDEVVPNIANFTLARALGLDIVQPVLREEPGLDEGDAPPIRGNLAPNVTAGLLQFDRIEEGGTIVMATHDNIGASEVGVAAWLHFIETAWADDAAEIIDPYEATGLSR